MSVYQTELDLKFCQNKFSLIYRIKKKQLLDFMVAFAQQNPLQGSYGLCNIMLTQNKN